MQLRFSEAPPDRSYAEGLEMERLKRLRKQMREQDDRRNPDKHDPTAPPVQIYVVCAWKASKPNSLLRSWHFVTWCRGPLTGHKMAQIRRRYSRKRRFSKHDPLTFVELRVFKHIGVERLEPPVYAGRRRREVA
jgi:hypothetical protein